MNFPPNIWLPKSYNPLKQPIFEASFNNSKDLIIFYSLFVSNKQAERVVMALSNYPS
jgi:hypothetical protein